MGGGTCQEKYKIPLDTPNEICNYLCMGKHLKKRPPQISIKIDGDLYQQLAEVARYKERTVAGQLRIYLRDALAAVKA